jgi:hypothetical protein
MPTSTSTTIDPFQSEPSSLQVLDIEVGNRDAAWNQIANDCPALKNRDSWGLKRLQHGLKPYVQSVVLEDGYICKDHRNLHSFFYSKRFRSGAVNCRRLHFFDQPFGTGSDGFDFFEGISGASDAYIGYSIIRPTEIARTLGRTIIDPSKIGLGIENNYFMLGAEFKVHLAGASLTARGYPYTSQDGEAMVCAHSALWGVCRYLSESYNQYRELYPYDLITGADTHAGRTVPYRGMTYADYSEILTRFGCHPILIHDAKMSGEDFWKTYTYVESGFPVLASTGSHVITLIGHTHDPDRIPAIDSNGLVRSSDFVSSFVVVDDNHFPYRRLKLEPPDNEYGISYRDKKDKIGTTDLSVKSLINLVVPLPEKVFLTADFARDNFEHYLLRGKWPEVVSGILSKYRGDKKNPLVTRQFVTSGSALKRVALKRYLKCKGGIFAQIAEMPLPHFVWVLELASLEGYRAKQSVGELVIDATANRFSDQCLLFARICGTLIVPTLANGVASDAKSASTGTGTLPPYRLYENSDVPNFRQFSHNLGTQDEV